MKHIFQISEAGAFITLMEEKLKPALKYLFWIDTKNHLELTRYKLNESFNFNKVYKKILSELSDTIVILIV